MNTPLNDNEKKQKATAKSASQKDSLRGGRVRGFYRRFPILGHLILMLMLSVLFVGAILVLLDRYTRHGESVTIPDVVGLSLDEAISTLENKGLRYELVDSVYTENAVPGSIHDVVPEEGDFVKPGRLVFLTVNAFSKPQSIIPELKDMSMRQARATLMGLGFTHISILYKPGEYDNLTQAVTDAAGKELLPGTRIDITAPLQLVISSNHISFSSEGYNYSDSSAFSRVDSLSEPQPEKIADEEAWW